jgi:hypothetical protein
METIHKLISQVVEVFNTPLFRIDTFRFTLWTFLYLTALVFCCSGRRRG